MAIVEDIKRMQDEGISKEEIIASLVQKGIPQDQITQAITQAQIKQAVDSPYPDNAYNQSSAPRGLEPERLKGMVPSMMAMQQEQTPPQYEEPPQPGQEYNGEYDYVGSPPQDSNQVQNYADQSYAQSYAAPQASLSSDTIAEISETVVTEKLAPLKKELEKVIDMRTTFEAKIESLSDRLKRIEKIIDRLQLSILQKVGEYSAGIEDIKKEMIESQKTFKALLPEHKRS